MSYNDVIEKSAEAGLVFDGCVLKTRSGVGDKPVERTLICFPRLTASGWERGVPIADSVVMGARVRIFQPDLVNLYGCSIGDDTRIGAFVEIQSGARIGARCKIQSHAFICDGVTIGDEVFVGHGVMFTNDLWPRATDHSGKLLGIEDWTLAATVIGDCASIGNGAIVLPVRLGKGVLVGAGAVVTRDVADYAIVVGNPARVVGDVRERRPVPGHLG